jgi:hypothetical protein
MKCPRYKEGRPKLWIMIHRSNIRRAYCRIKMSSTSHLSSNRIRCSRRLSNKSSSRTQIPNSKTMASRPREASACRYHSLLMSIKSPYRRSFSRRLKYPMLIWSAKASRISKRSLSLKSSPKQTLKWLFIKLMARKSENCTKGCSRRRLASPKMFSDRSTSTRWLSMTATHLKTSSKCSPKGGQSTRPSSKCAN